MLKGCRFFWNAIGTWTMDFKSFFWGSEKMMFSISNTDTQYTLLALEYINGPCIRGCVTLVLVVHDGQRDVPGDTR